MIISWDGYRGHLSEGLGFWIPEFRNQLRCLVSEANGVMLPSSDENLTVGKDDAIMKSAWIGHRVDRSDFGCSIRVGYSDDVSIGSRVGVYRA